MTSLVQRLRSLRHGFWYGVSERVRWSRGLYREEPAVELPQLAHEEAQRIAALQRRYQIRFELRLNAATSIRNYEYLDILDCAWREYGQSPPLGLVVQDIGCASFWYAATLQTFYRPASLTGVEIEGHRLYRNGHTRRDYAAGYLVQMPEARFLIGDYAGLESPADLISAWFPFVTPATILAWRLPLRLLRPEAIFARAGANLRPGGRFLMVNHGPAEAAIAARICAGSGLKLEFRACPGSPLSRYRAEPPMLSCWRRRS